jgi:hypothetical protein
MWALWQFHQPALWDGPVLTEPRTQLTVGQLTGDEPLPLLDMSFFARPDWAKDSTEPFSGSVSFGEAKMVSPKTRDSYEGEDLFPKLKIEFISHKQELIPRVQGVIDTRSKSGSYWDVIIGAGAVWREDGDDGWSRASFPLNFVGRYVGEVRNCVATFAYHEDAISNVYVQCSQETAVLDAEQLGNIRAMVPATYKQQTFRT